MPLSNLPGPWRWEKRNGYWWRIHQEQHIEDGPHRWNELNVGLGGFGEGSRWLDRDGEPIPVVVASDLLADDEYTVVKQDVFMYEVEPVMVSTVWLGLDHNWWPDRPPMIFETMIFGGKLNHELWRYSTEEQALAGHEDTVKLLHAAYADPTKQQNGRSDGEDSGGQV
jgi:hypothetical protein